MMLVDDTNSETQSKGMPIRKHRSSKVLVFIFGLVGAATQLVNPNGGMAAALVLPSPFPNGVQVLPDNSLEEEYCGGLSKSTKSNQSSNISDTRRVALERLLVKTTATNCAIAALFVLPGNAIAAPPVRAQETDNFGAKLERLLRSKPPKVLRPKVNLDFAVLLMRSSYNALDAVDCVAMDQFQRDFFLFRQAEYEYYNAAVGPGAMQQGQLTDPLYFDFISFAQYATISREMGMDSPAVFVEQQPREEDDGDDEELKQSDQLQRQRFVSVVVRRDPKLLDNSLLPAEHGRLVGESILDRLNEIFRDTKSAITSIRQGSRPPANVVFSSLEQLLKLFLINGFAYDGQISMNERGASPSSSRDATGTEFTIKLIAPATLWSGKALQLRRANPVNDFLLKTASVLVSRAGYKVSKSSVKYTQTEEITSFMLL